MDIINKSTFNNLDLILANPKISLGDNTILHDELTTKKIFPCMQHMIDVLKTEYDVIIVDCPGELNFYTLNAIAISNRAIGVIMPTVANVEGMFELLNIFSTVLKGKVSDIILTMVSSRPSKRKNDQMNLWKEKFLKYQIDQYICLYYSENVAYRHQFEQDYFYLPEEQEYSLLKEYFESVVL